MTAAIRAPQACRHPACPTARTRSRGTNEGPACAQSSHVVILVLLIDTGSGRRSALVSAACNPAVAAVDLQSNHTTFRRYDPVAEMRKKVFAAVSAGSARAVPPPSTVEAKC